MGYAFYQLVPAAIMYDHPGCTNEELAQLFMQTNMHTGEIPLYRLIDQSWRHELKFKSVSKESDEDEKRVFHQNPFKPLVVKSRDPLERTQKEKRAFISAHNLRRWDNTGKDLFTEGHHATNFHCGIYGVGEELNLPKRRYNGWLHFAYASNFLKERRVKAAYEDWDNGTTIFFPNLTSLEEHTRLSPYHLFDFSQTEGSFRDLHRADQLYRWTCKNGKYYFEFERMRDTVDVTSFSESIRRYREPCSYTDFIVTFEAVRKKAWKMLSYCGLQHRDNFFKKWSDAQRIYERALWNSFTSLAAKTQKMTHTEFMRMRLESRIHT